MNYLQRCYLGAVNDVKVTLRLREFRPGKIARRTREVVTEGGSVVWLWHRDTDFRRALSALGDWKAPHGGVWRIERGQSMAYFAATADPSAALSYFVRPSRGR